MDFIAIKENNYEMCRQGEVAGILYIIVSGTCQVTIDGKAIAVLGESDIFGENSFFADVNGVSRNEVTVTTINNEIGNVQVLALPRVKFNKLLAAGTLTEDFEKKLKEVAKKRKQVLRQGQVAQQTQELNVNVQMHPPPKKEASDPVKAIKVLNKTNDATVARNWFKGLFKKNKQKLLGRLTLEDDPESLSTVKVNSILTRLRVEQPMALLQRFETKPGSVSKKKILTWCESCCVEDSQKT